MIAQDIFDEFKAERKKIGFKRRFTRKHKFILRIIEIINVGILALLIYLAVQLDLGYLVPIAFLSFLIIFVTFAVLFNKWDITDYDECNDRLLKETKFIILNAFNRLKEKSNVSIRNTVTFIDYIIDYVNNLDEDTRKKKELAFKIFTIIVFPVALGVAYSLFNRLETDTLRNTLITILIVSFILLFIVVELYEIFFLTSRKKYIRQSFLQILQILKASVNLDTIPQKTTIENDNKELLRNYFETHQEITIKQAQELFEIPYSKSKILLDEFTEEGVLIKHKCKNKNIYELFSDKDK